jgi:3-dehydrosphinganine reductase
MMDFYRGKSVLITGGTSGIGLALATLLIQEHCHVAILSRQQVLIDTALAELTKIAPIGAPGVIAIQADVTKRAELNKILDDYTNQHGVPDIVINCAGVAHPGTFTSLKPEIFDWLMDVNYFGTVNVLKNLVPVMKSRHSGVIVNISSVAGFIGIYGYTAYSASKFAVTGFTDALRSELKPYGIQVSIVFPPDTKTPQLDYESKFKPYITQQVAGSASLMSAEAVASEIIRKVAHKKYIILPGSEGKLFYTLKNLAGRNLYPVLDMMVKNAIGKIKMG